MKKSTILTALALCGCGFVFGQATPANQNAQGNNNSGNQEKFATPAEKEAYVNANQNESYQLFTKHTDTSTEQQRESIRSEEKARLNNRKKDKEKKKNEE